MVDLRIYRASLVVALLAVVVVMFSLDQRPPVLEAKLAPDAFKGGAAYADMRRLVARYPNRRPGASDDERLATLLEGRLRKLGFDTSRDRFSAQYEGQEVQLSNLTGVLSAASDRQLVIFAHRDSDGRPGASSAATTGTLLQLAAALAGSSRNKTLVVVSADGGSADLAGARRFAARYPDRDKIDAVVVLDEVGSVDERRPFIVPWSAGPGRPALQTVRTAESAIWRETGRGPRSDSLGVQLLRQAWPLTLRAQGPLVGRGLDALTITSRGELPRQSRFDTVDRVSERRLSSFGRAAFSTVLALDSAPVLESSPPRYVVAGRQLIPGWAFSLLAVGLLLPAVLSAFDAFARANRRDMPSAPWMLYALAGSVPLALGLALALGFALVGWLPRTPSEALSPLTRPTFEESLPPLIALALVSAAGWKAVRAFVMRGVEPPGLPGPAFAVALALVFSIEVLLICLLNPFAALMLVPAAHLFLLAGVAGSPRRALLVTGLATALVLPLLAFAYYGVRFDLGLEPTRYALMVVTAGTASVWTGLVGALVVGTLAASAAIVRREGGSAPASPITVRGPATYAGPGSLGGTRSALER